LDHTLFEHDEQIAETLDKWTSRIINTDSKEIIVIGKPNDRSDGTPERVKLTLKIEKMETIQ